jgi:hypothetical protein
MMKITTKSQIDIRQPELKMPFCRGSYGQLPLQKLHPDSTAALPAVSVYYKST